MRLFAGSNREASLKLDDSGKLKVRLFGGFEVGKLRVISIWYED